MKQSTYTRNAKKQATRIRRESKKTGGGPPPEELIQLQDKDVGIIGNTPIDGIETGIDTCPGMEMDGAPIEEPTETRDVDSSNENEQLRLEIDQQRLLTEQQKHQLYMTKLNISTTKMDVDVVDTPSTSVEKDNPSS
ncbi:Hypothetical predicted protein [Mytilus galloprovincialis]|uniref:Uncharacterized protein n=1 Tax=Mytilus galloprovincialis TaxID=29158 RepID=A0A8B6GT69_MYTGA|nr:Hypothetical predicted protein [Mytilus galloprovincialis]